MAGVHIAVPIDRAAAVPLARQVQAHLERLIREQRLAPGVKLPSTRELAASLRVNRATVALAYEELTAAGWTRAHVGQGTFVAEPDGGGPAAPPPPAPPFDWSGLFSRSAHLLAIDERRTAPAGDQRVVAFAGGMPDSGLFPTDGFRRALNDVVRKDGAALLQYHATQGYPPLRRYLATYLLRSGIEARPEEILIVNGSQQGFDLIARTFLDPGDVMVIEQPTYPRALQVFRASGARLVGVPWGDEGPRPDALERALERSAAKLFYCQSSAHNPTGLQMSAAVARQVLAAAARHQVPIVEDGFDDHLFYGQRPGPPLRARDPHGLVIYLGTFSKILFPGLRLGWVVAAPPVIERLEAAKQLVDLHTSPLIQAAVHRFCERRLLDRHLRRVAAEYARRRDALLTALARHLTRAASWTEPRGGFSLLVTLPDGVDTAVLLPQALAQGVSFTPGAVFFPDGSGRNTLRLSFSAVPLRRIDEGVRRLARVLQGRAGSSAPGRAAPGSSVPVV
jgi:DNA-binding transcriptional MocR family regulator